VQAAVEAAGHVVIACGSGRDGIARIQHALRDELDVVIVGLPGGEPIIDAAVALAPRRPVVLAASTGSAAEAIRRASEAGADLAMARPHDVERLAPLLLAASRLVDERRQAINARGSETMLRARLDALVEPEAGALQPFELFQRVLELELKRARRYAYPLAVALFALEIPPPAPPPGIRGILRARAGNALIHSIRDIDMATALDDERFLVLLPYTSLGGAAEVAHRILESVAAGTPVTAADRVFEPRVVGAVAGAGPGQPLSFARLMRDATRALEQARRDGAELAVPIDVRGAE
jgi:PleD family two-component response regulator